MAQGVICKWVACYCQVQVFFRNVFSRPHSGEILRLSSPNSADLGLSPEITSRFPLPCLTRSRRRWCFECVPASETRAPSACGQTRNLFRDNSLKTAMHADGTSSDRLRDASQLSIPPIPQPAMLTQLRSGTLNESNPCAFNRQTTSMISRPC